MCEAPCLRPHPGWVHVPEFPSHQPSPFKLYNVFSITSPTLQRKWHRFFTFSINCTPATWSRNGCLFLVSFHVCLFHERRQWRSVRLNADTVKFCRGKCVFRDTLLSFTPCLSSTLFLGIYGRKKIQTTSVFLPFLPFPPHSLHPSLSIPTLFPYSNTYQSATLLSHVQLSATPWTVVYQTPLSMEFSRQDTGVSCHSCLQGIFLTERLNQGLLHWGKRFIIWATREVHKTFTWKLQNARPWYLLSTKWAHLV